MATLTTAQRSAAREYLSRQINVNYTKAQFDAALQAVEDYFETTARAGLGQAIETAAPTVFSNAEKKAIAGYYLLQKSGREGIG